MEPNENQPNFSEKPQDLSELSPNMPQNAPETPEMPSETAEPLDRIVAPTPQETPLNVPTEQVASDKLAKKSKKAHKKWPIIVVVIVVVLALVGTGVAFWLLSGNNDGNISAKDPNNKPSVGGSEQSPEVTVVQVDIDDPLIKETYGLFDQLSTAWYVDTLAKFYHDEANFVGNGLMSKDIMLLLAFYDAEKTECHAGYETDYHDYLVQQLGAENLEMYGGGAECIKGEELRKQVEKIFGRPLELKDGDQIAFYGNIGVYNYHADFDEFVFTSYGFGGVAIDGYERYVQSAETKGDELYVYERVAERSYVKSIDVYDEQLGAETSIGQVLKYTDLDGKFIYELEEYFTENDDAAREKMKEAVLEKGSLVKWTFKKNSDGKYVYDTIERVN